MTVTKQHFDFIGECKNLLLIAIPNEVLNGFEIAEFERVVGISKSSLRALILALEHEPDAVVNREQAIVLRNVLNVVMLELNSEFQTRTGFELSEAAKVVFQLDQFIASQGVL